MTHTSHRRRTIPTPAPVIKEPTRETGLPKISSTGKKYVFRLPGSEAIEGKRKGPVRRVSKSKERLNERGIPRSRWWRV